MLNPGYTTISKFLIQQVPEGPHGRELAALLVDVAAVVKAISAAVGAFALNTNSKDAALLVSLAEGSYTAVVSGVGSTTGTALVELYVVP